MSQPNVIDAPNFIQPATIDFNALHAKAMAMTDPTPVPAATPQTPTVETPPQVTPAVAPSTPPSQAAPTPSTPTVLEIPDDALVKVKIDGVEQTVPYKDYRDSIQREAAFTKRMQTLADQRRQAEADFAAREAKLQQQAEMIETAKLMFQNPQAATQPATPQAPVPPSDPNEIATVGEVQRYINGLLQQIQTQSQEERQATLQAIEAAKLDLEQRREDQANAVQFTTALNATLAREDLKIVKEAIPFAEESLRFQVAQLGPQSIAEAAKFAEEIAAEWAGKLRALSLDTQKRQQVEQARAIMEPPAGSPPPIQPQVAKPGSFFRKDGNLDWDSLRARARTMLGE